MLRAYSFIICRSCKYIIFYGLMATRYILACHLFMRRCIPNPQELARMHLSSGKIQFHVKDFIVRPNGDIKRRESFRTAFIKYRAAFHYMRAMQYVCGSCAKVPPTPSRSRARRTKVAQEPARLDSTPTSERYSTRLDEISAPCLATRKELTVRTSPSDRLGSARLGPR